MLNRRKVRELAMQTLFLWDSQNERNMEAALQLALDISDDPEVRKLALEMADGAWAAREGIDQWIGRLAPQWPPRRQPAVDRNLLRLAVWELTSSPTPPRVVIDEAIEMAKQFSTENSSAFVNGVLDSVLREHQRLTQMDTGATGSGGTTTIIVHAEDEPAGDRAADAPAEPPASPDGAAAADPAPLPTPEASPSDPQ